MKSRFFQTALLLFLGLMLFSCNKEDNLSLDQSLKTFMEFKSKNMASEVGGVNNFMSVISASQFNSKNLNLAGYNPDEGYVDGGCLEYDSTQNWSFFTCATVTEINNEDGTTTTIYDYGDGCDEYGSLMKGKITYIWKNEGNNYESKVLYEHYYCNGTEINGYSENSFTSDGNSYFEFSKGGTGVAGDSGEPYVVDSGEVYVDDSISYPEITFNWSGTSTSEEDLTITDDGGEEYTYNSVYSTKWDNSTYTVLTGAYNYISKSDNYEYHYLVSQPLVTNYECSISWVPVSGIETTTCVKSGKTDVLAINYGDGTCDSFALVTENGVTTNVDMAKWYSISNDSTVTSTKSMKVRIKRQINPVLH
ncbi:MAG: hypothetical protein NTY32_10350 [Bacteroidia bacterium]|nr:hypothetical protein [Bacteroidia bacterium]